MQNGFDISFLSAWELCLGQFDTLFVLPTGGADWTEPI